MKNRDMRKKFRILALCSFVLATAIFLFTFYIFHHLTPEMTFTPERLTEPGKPLLHFSLECGEPFSSSAASSAW